MIPDLCFVLVEQFLGMGLIGGNCGLRKGKNISAYILHLEKEVKRVNSIIFKLYTIDILKVHAHRLFFPDPVWSLALVRINFLVCFALIQEVQVVMETITKIVVFRGIVCSKSGWGP
jgi:hypothetical protein